MYKSHSNVDQDTCVYVCRNKHSYLKFADLVQADVSAVSTFSESAACVYIHGDSTCIYTRTGAWVSAKLIREDTSTIVQSTACVFFKYADFTCRYIQAQLPEHLRS